MNPYADWTSVPVEDEDLQPKEPQAQAVPADYAGWQDVPVEQVEAEDNAFISTLFAETLPAMSLDEPSRRGAIGRLSKELDLSEAFVERNFERLQRSWEEAQFDPERWRQQNPELEDIIFRRPPLAPVVLQDERVGTIKRWWRSAMHSRRLQGIRARELHEGVRFQVTMEGDDPSTLTLEKIPDPEFVPPGTPDFWRRWMSEEALRGTVPFATAFHPSDEEVLDAFKAELQRRGELPADQMAAVEDERAQEGRSLTGLGRLKAIWMTYEDHRRQAEANDIAAGWALARLQGQDERALRSELQLERMEPELLPRDYGQGTLEQNFHDAAMLAASQVETFKGMGAGGLASYVAVAAPVLAATRNARAAHAAGMKAIGLGARAGASTFSFNQELGSAVRDYRTMRTDDGQLLDDEVVIGAGLIYASVAAWIEQWSFLDDLRVLGPVAEAFGRGGGKAYISGLLKESGFRGMARRMARAWVSRARTEALEEMTQEAFQMLTGYAARSAQAGELQEAQPLEAIGDILETGQTTFVGSLITGAATSVATAPFNVAAMKAIERFESGWEAGERSAIAIELVEQVANTDLAKADPDAAAELVAAETEKTGETVTELHVDPEATLRLFQEEGLDAASTAERLFGPDGLRLLQEAQATGGKVAISVAHYMERIAGTPLAKKLLPHMTTRPGRKTAAQLQAMREEIRAEGEALAKRFEEEDVPAESNAESRFIDNLERQIRETGIYDASQARRAIALWRAFARVVSERAGLDLDTVFDRYSMEVTREGQAKKAEDAAAERRPVAPEPVRPVMPESADPAEAQAEPAAPPPELATPETPTAPEAAPEPEAATPEPEAATPEPTPAEPPAGPRPEVGPPAAEPGTAGRATTIITPQRPDGEPATYRVIEAADLIASHDEHGFAPNPAYPGGVQEREYHRQPEEQAKVVQGAQQLNPALLLSDSPTAVDGPPIVTSGEQALVMGGNGRSMMIKRAFEDPAKAEEYRQALLAKAEQFGLDPEEIQRMRAPVLVRSLDDVPSTAPTEALVAAVRRTNEGMTQALTPMARAVAEARLFAPETVEAISDLLAQNPDDTLREVMRKRPRSLIEILRRDGIITPQNQTQWIRGQELTEEARDRIEGMFLGRVVGSGDRMARTAKSILNKLERVAPSLLRVEGTNPDYSETQLVQDAIDLLNEARARELSVADLVAQVSLFDQSERDPDVVRTADLIETSRPLELAARFRSWANLASFHPSQVTMFSANPTREEARRALLAETIVVKQEQGSLLLYQPPPLPAWARQGHSRELAEALERVESEIRNEPVEVGVFLTADGHEVLRKVSPDASSVTFSGLEVEQARKNGELVFTHNHPSGHPLSPADVVAAVFMDVAEVRAVAPDGAVFRIRRPPGGWRNRPPIESLTRLSAEQRAKLNAWLVEYKQKWDALRGPAYDQANMRFAIEAAHLPAEVQDRAWKAIFSEELLAAYNGFADQTGEGWRVERLGIREGRSAAPSETLEAIRKAAREEGVILSAIDMGDTVHISRLTVPLALRRQGLGTQFLERLAAFADSNGKILTVNPSETFDDAETRALTRLFRRFGFVRNRFPSRDASISGEMYRRPQVRRFDQPAYHGTPHRFDRFSLEAIGLGEGTQFEGWGLYFSSSREVAEWYQKALTSPETRLTYAGTSIEELSSRRSSLSATERAQFYALARIEAELLDRHLPAKSNEDAIRNALRSTEYELQGAQESRRDELVAIIDALRKLDPEQISLVTTERGPGQVVEAEIPDDDFLLDYDKPVREMPEAVREALGRLRANMDKAGWLSQWLDRNRVWHFEQLTGQDIYDMLRVGLREGAILPANDEVRQAIEDGRPDKAASLYLKHLGIPGLTYIGESSGERNFVVWTEEAIQVVQRYEQAQREAADPTQSPEFKRWFGDSKVVDSEGRPLVMYHGTAREFDAFDPAARGSNTGARGAERAFFFARSPADASFYMEMSERQAREEWETRQVETEIAGEPFDEPPPSGRIVQAYLRAENPLILGFDDEESSVRGELLEELINDDVAALDYAQGNGYDAVIWPYGNATNSGYTVAVFEPEQIKSTENVGAFDPADPNIFRQSAGPRGFMERRGDAIRIVLTAKADFSTFLHETAHVWLEILADLSEREDVAPGFREQWAQILDFLGVKNRSEIETQHHEKWAESFEAYLMEGKPPSNRPELVGAFETFRLWLIRIYRAIRGLDAQMSDEVRDIFDRLIATDEEIQNAREQSSYSVETLVDGPESIKDEKERALWTARVNVQARILKERQRAQEDWWKEEEKRLTAEAEAEYQNLPGRKAWNFLQGKVYHADGSPLDLEQGKTALDRDSVRAILGDEKAAKNRIPLRKGGVDPGAVAEMFGFESGEDMVKTIASMPTMREWAKERAQEIMRERYPDLLAERDRLRDEVHALLFSKSRIGWAIREWEEIAKKARRKPSERNLNLEAIEVAARIILERKKIRELSPGAILNDEREAAEQAARALMEGDHEAALDAKERQILNMFLYRRARELRDEVNRARRYVLKRRRDQYRADIAKAFEPYLIAWDAIRAIVGRGSSQDLTIDLAAAREAFEDAIEKAKADEQEFGFDVQAIRELLADPQNKRWAELTVDEALNVRDALIQIRSNAVKLLKIELEGELRSLEVLETMVEEEAAALPDLGKAPPAEQQVGLGRRAFDVMVGINGNLIDPEMTFRSLGPTFERIVWARYLDAKQKKYELIERVLDPLFRMWRSLPKETMRRRWEVIDGLKTELPIPEELNIDGEAPRDRMWLLMVALNMGNESNRERLLQPFGWTAAQVLKVLNKHLTEAEWKWVQSIWDLFDKELWPLIEAKEKRVNGFAPPKIEAVEIVTPYGKLRGGYFPARYDPRASLDDVADRQEVGDRGIFAAGYRRAATRKSHTKKRADSYANVVRLDWGVFPSHVAQIVHDVAFDEYVRETARFLRREKIRNLLYRRLGRRRWREPEDWLRAVANIQAVTGAHLSSDIARAFNFFRDRMIVGAIGWSATVAMADFANPFMAMAASKEAGGTSIRWGIPAYLAAIPLSPSYVPMRRFAFSKSPELRNRSAGWTQQRREQFLRELGRKRNVLSRALVAIGNTVWFFMEQTDKMASTQIWLARYWEERHKGASEAQASKLADEAVRRMLPGPERAELPRLLRDPGALGALLMFQGFFNKVYNLAAAEVGQAVRSGARAARTGSAADWGRFGLRTAQATGSILGILFFVNVFGELLAGRGPEDDEEWEDWLAAKMAAAPLLLVPIVGSDAANVVESALRERYVHPPSRAPSISFAWDMARRIGKVVDSDEEDSERAWALVEIGLASARLPVNQTRRTLRFIEAAANDEAWAETPLEYISGLLYGERDDQGANVFTLLQGVIDETTEPLGPEPGLMLTIADEMDEVQ